VTPAALLVCLGDPAELGDLGGLAAAVERTLVMSDARSAEDVDALRGRLGVERLTVLAHGASAQVAFSYIATHRGRVDRLVLVMPEAEFDRRLQAGLVYFHKPILVVDVDPHNPTSTELLSPPLQHFRRVVLPYTSRFPWRDNAEVFRDTILSFLGFPGALPFDAVGDGPPLLCVGGQPVALDADGPVAYLGHLGGLSMQRRLIRIDPTSCGDLDEFVAGFDALRRHLGLDRPALLTHAASAGAGVCYAGATGQPRPSRAGRTVSHGIGGT
jgi:pimeloyl-ACP methyl ester carboxylesterase